MRGKVVGRLKLALTVRAEDDMPWNLEIDVVSIPYSSLVGRSRRNGDSAVLPRPYADTSVFTVFQSLDFEAAIHRS